MGAPTQAEQVGAASSTVKVLPRGNMLIRAEKENDQAAVYQVNAAAFETPAEAELVETLRAYAQPLISLVAEVEEAIVGHILFSPVCVSTDTELKMMGLAPMAVAPAHQRRGIGAALVRAGLERCKALKCSAVVVLGHPEYYPRFGFLSASRFGLCCEYNVPDEVFLALELQPGALADTTGMVQYHTAFRNV